MLFKNLKQPDFLSRGLPLHQFDDPSGTLPFLVQLNAFFHPLAKSEKCLRRLNFLSCELKSQCHGIPESEKLSALNHFFFSKKKFRISSTKENCSPQDRPIDEYIIENVIGQKKGSPLSITHIYLYLAAQIQLSISPIQLLDSSYILKWVSQGKNFYFDLLKKGELLNEEEILSQLNLAATRKKGHGLVLLETLSIRKILIIYLKELVQVYQSQSQLRRACSLLGLLIELDPLNLTYIKKRAILLKDLGLFKLSLGEIKRYFSYSGKKNIPKEIRKTYYDINGKLPQ